MDVYHKICNTEKISPRRPIQNQKRSDALKVHLTPKRPDELKVHLTPKRLDKLKVHVPKRSDEFPPHTPERHVHMINGGFAGGGISKSSCKRHLKEYISC